MTEDRPSAYPLPRSAAGSRSATDPRMSFALTYDISGVLEAHGYPRLESRDDWRRLHECLFKFLYDEPSG